MKIISAKYKQDYNLEIEMSNGDLFIADFKEFFNIGDPNFKFYTDLNNFRNFEVAHGMLSWGKGDIEIPAEVIFAKRAGIRIEKIRK